ncbi:MAG: hypothetical protein J0I20_33755 [Chloroflexi bacterium]|nr:hypothetical protein [Chloroflexota bacterium]OJW05572.1 MAG: hypothetical protein BGO39_02850 [Chloroflexi bacterium 54-19]
MFTRIIKTLTALLTLLVLVFIADYYLDRLKQTERALQTAQGDIWAYGGSVRRHETEIKQLYDWHKELEEKGL